MTQPRGITVKDVGAPAFITAYASHLKREGKLELPKWVDAVKTGSSRELAPYNPDWFYVRTASVARKIYLRQNIGVGALKKVYGGSKRRGVKPCHFKKASGAVIRAAFSQLEKLGVVEKDTHGSRRISQAGQRDLDLVASGINK